MNWKECVDLLYRYDLGNRNTWPPNVLGFDCDPEVFTIEDVWGAISWVWTWPGDALLNIEMVNRFFVLEQAAVGHLSSVILGWFIFLNFAALPFQK